MKIENQVCSLELAKKLNELGVKQESSFYWRVEKGNPNDTGILVDGFHKNATFDYISAFSVAELGEMLPKQLTKNTPYHKGKRPYYMNINWSETGQKWRYGYVNKEDNEYFALEFADTEADARAILLIYLIENNLISYDK